MGLLLLLSGGNLLLSSSSSCFFIYFFLENKSFNNMNHEARGMRVCMHGVFLGGVVLGLCCVWFVEQEYEREREREDI